VVHTVTGTFTADVAKTLTAAPRIAVLQDGFEAIAIGDFNAAGIPDSAGAAWAAASIDVLSEATVAGPTTTSHVDGGLWNADGTARYCNVTSMHYDATARTPEVVQEVRSWLNANPGNHAFMECQATATFENAGHFLTTAGIRDDNPNGNNPPAPLVNRFPDDPLTQLDGAFNADTGAVDSIGLAAGSTFAPGVRTLVNQQNRAITSRIIWLSGRLDGNNADGKVTYLAGDDYSTATPLSANPLTNGAKVMLDSLFESGCATASGGQPVVTLTKAGPATTSGNQITYTIRYANTGTGTANNATITDPIPAGSTFVSASNGGSNAAGTVTWTLGNLAVGASGSVTVTVGVTADGAYANRAVIAFKIGVTPRTVTSNTVTTTRDTRPPGGGGSAVAVAAMVTATACPTGSTTARPWRTPTRPTRTATCSAMRATPTRTAMASSTPPGCPAVAATPAVVASAPARSRRSGCFAAGGAARGSPDSRGSTASMARTAPDSRGSTASMARTAPDSRGFTAGTARSLPGLRLAPSWWGSRCRARPRHR